ncbi:MAG: hypothetical protein JWO19_4395 [Bryobacterales bacterium]|nr:hypothetical protein [Bryobacterales bacterium]
MKLTDKARAALQEPGTRAVITEMTPERKEKYSRIAGAVVDLLRRNTETPGEAYMVLQFVMHGFEESYGIRGGIIMEHGDKQD